MVVLNRMSRFHLVQMAVERSTADVRIVRRVADWCAEKLSEHERWIVEHGEDMPGIAGWRWKDV
jgi:xylulose-5-phosphate/fructose-6-phosphate phosphoketolase